MQNQNFNKQQIIQLLQQHESGYLAVDICRHYGMGHSLFYKWKQRYRPITLQRNPHHAPQIYIMIDRSAFSKHATKELKQQLENCCL